jgi:hypothetical protein
VIRQHLNKRIKDIRYGLWAEFCHWESFGVFFLLDFQLYNQIWTDHQLSDNEEQIRSRIVFTSFSVAMPCLCWISNSFSRRTCHKATTQPNKPKKKKKKDSGRIPQRSQRRKTNKNIQDSLFRYFGPIRAKEK